MARPLRITCVQFDSLAFFSNDGYGEKKLKRRHGETEIIGISVSPYHLWASLCPTSRGIPRKVPPRWGCTLLWGLTTGCS